MTAIRQATKVFKYLGKNQLDKHHQDIADEDWVHQTKHIRAVIKNLRSRKTNVLMATSVVEEGVDVEACSFVVSFDQIKTVKSYIQMKGRARQQVAVSCRPACFIPDNRKLTQMRDFFHVY